MVGETVEGDETDKCRWKKTDPGKGKKRGKEIKWKESREKN